MALTPVGGLVKVADGGPPLDAIIFDTPSRSKVVVAVVDRARGPVLRTVHPDALTERSAEGPSDPALRRLIKRTPPAAHDAARGGSGAGRGSAGHTRGAAHRTTGR